MSTRILLVAIFEKMILRQTLLFPVMLAPGIVCHALPVHYCTSYPVKP